MFFLRPVDELRMELRALYRRTALDTKLGLARDLVDRFDATYK